MGPHRLRILVFLVDFPLNFKKSYLLCCVSCEARMTHRDHDSVIVVVTLLVSDR